jgi:hypothetical protein
MSLAQFWSLAARTGKLASMRTGPGRVHGDTERRRGLIVLAPVAAITRDASEIEGAVQFGAAAKDFAGLRAHHWVDVVILNGGKGPAARDADRAAPWRTDSATYIRLGRSMKVDENAVRAFVLECALRRHQSAEGAGGFL